MGKLPDGHDFTNSLGDGELRWYVAMIKPLAENQVARDLAALGIPAMLPMIRKQTTKGPVNEPAFPRYLFVELNEAPSSWTMMKRIANLQGFIGGARPTAVPPRAMAAVIARFSENAAGELRAPINESDTVRVTSGAFAGLEGLVTKTKGERVRILLSLFGRPTEATVRKNDVELARST